MDVRPVAVIILSAAIGCGSVALPSASGSGSSGVGGGGSSSSSGVAGLGGAASVVCPFTTSPCLAVESLNGSCLVVATIAGTACEMNGHPDKCNGYGICGVIACAKVEDCGTSPNCFGVTCDASGPLAGVCATYATTGDDCDLPCSPVIQGPEVAACAAVGTGTPWHCERKSGPAPGPCLALADGAPFTYCCKY